MYGRKGNLMKKETNKPKYVGKEGKSKGMKLTSRLLLVALLPTVLTFIVGVLSVKMVCANVIEAMVKHELNVAQYAFEVSVGNLGGGVYRYIDGKFYKGTKNIGENTTFFDNFSNEVDLQVAVYYGDTCVATSLKDEEGNRMKGTTADADMYEYVVANGGDYYGDDIEIAGNSYYGMYCPLWQPDGSEIVGMTFVGLDKSNVMAIYNKNLWQSVAVLSLILIAGFLLTLLSLRVVVKAISKVVGDLNELSEGKLHIRTNEKLAGRADEVGDIASSINKLASGLSGIVVNIKEASDGLGSISSKFSDSFSGMTDYIENVDRAVDEIAKSTTSQAEDTANVGNEIQYMGEAIETTANNVDSLVGNTEKMKEYNRSVGATIDELVKINNETRKAIETVYDQTNMTNSSAQDIQSAADMITDIADQTSLLSLNASIEAARAGEYGKGFAVVADEIKKLSEQSAESAQLISSIIEKLIVNSNTTVDTMGNVTTVMERQGREIDKTRQVFENLNTEIGEVSGAVDNIRGEVDKLNGLKETVLTSVQNLASIAEQNAASTQETSASMQELRQTVSNCNSEVGKIVDTSNGLAENIGVFTLNKD
jgi:methyl-accepting chemotaxis protein